MSWDDNSIGFIHLHMQSCHALHSDAAVDTPLFKSQLMTSRCNAYQEPTVLLTSCMPALQGACSVHVQLRALCHSLRVCGAPIPAPPERGLHAHHLLDDRLRGQRRQVLLLLAGVPDGPHPQHLPGAAAGHGHPQPAGGPAPGLRWASLAFPPFLEHVLSLLVLLLLEHPLGSANHPQPEGGVGSSGVSGLPFLPSVAHPQSFSQPGMFHGRCLSLVFMFVSSSASLQPA